MVLLVVLVVSGAVLVAASLFMAALGRARAEAEALKAALAELAALAQPVEALVAEVRELQAAVWARKRPRPAPRSAP